MTPFNQYLQLNSISRRTLFYWIEKGDVLSIKQPDGIYIVTTSDLTLQDPKAIAAIKESKREEWNRLILTACNALTNKLPDANKLRNETIQYITNDAEHWQGKGIFIPGYNLKSLYRKIKKGKVHREKRSDFGTYRNSVLQSVTTQQKLLAAAWHLFGKPSAKLNYSLVYDKIKDFAEANEAFWELADIPESTMLHFLKKEFVAFGLDKAHKLLNHYNLYKKTKATNRGAFTKDVQFMDYIIGDDHKLDIDKVLVWDEVRKEFRKETVRVWVWIEGKTQKILSYTLLPRDLNAEDLKLSLMEALSVYGKPAKAVMIDNGIGKSSAFQDFCLKCGVHIEYSKPYEPTNKSTVERLFGYIKNEFDVYEENYVGANHPVEGRHRSNQLSAEDCKVTFEQYEKRFDAYIAGFFQTRERLRQIDNKRINISIKDLYDSYARNWTKIEISPRILRYASQQFKRVRYNNGAQFIIKKQVYSYMPNPDLSHVFNGRVFDLYFDMKDMNRVDMYAVDSFIDRTTGQQVTKGEFICSLESFELFTTSERKARTAKTNKKIEKALREISNLYVDKVVASTVEDTGKINDERKRVKKQIYNEVKKSLPAEKIRTIVVKASEVKTTDSTDLPDSQEKIIITPEDYKELEEIPVNNN